MDRDTFVGEVTRLAPPEAAVLLAPLPDGDVAAVLRSLNPAVAHDVLLALGEDRRRAVIAAAPPDDGRQWAHNLTYPGDSVGRVMEPPHAVFLPGLTVAETVERIRELVKTTFVTYGFVTDEGGVLLGVVAMRDLLLAGRGDRLEAVMLRDVFSLRPEMPLLEAARLVVARHFPVYPVCDAGGRLVGIVRGRTLFEEQALEISAQPGAMVGVETEERLSTPWPRSLRFRHPWLQLNLLTAFVAAAVVGAFQGTIDRLVVLAVFLPVLAGQSGNTGCQALAVTLARPHSRRAAPRDRPPARPEGGAPRLPERRPRRRLGRDRHVRRRPLRRGIRLRPVLSFVVFLAMVGSCLVSGLAGALIPLTLKRFGADPATASSIFLTTATDVASMGLFLGLATPDRALRVVALQGRSSYRIAHS